jgi:glucosamine--fructose-6-phosphate aminotransferase (isomerizing)
MCGIVGYVGPKQAQPILVEGLKRLEYRGYDSAGLAVAGANGKLDVIKCVGRMSALEEALSAHPLAGQPGIGHTRWATHGRPSNENAHPHCDCKFNIAVVHNGIIENYQSLREWLSERGHELRSETDTEVIPHLIEEYYQGDLVAAVRKAIARLHGSFALAIVAASEPDKIIGVRKDSPLIVGLGEGENYLASDIPATLSHTRRTYILNDGEMAILTADKVTVTDFEGNEVEKKVFEVTWEAAQAEKGGYEHFMLKEIHEQPKAFRDTLTGRIKDGRPNLPELNLSAYDIRRLQRIHIVACGTAYHAGLVGKTLIERLARVPVEVDVASEFRYRDPIIGDNSLMIVISQSGETLDTLVCLREGKRQGMHVLAITNVVGSSVAREADDVILTLAGPEIAVASTKAYTTQLIALTLLAVHFASVRGSTSAQELDAIMEGLRQLPAQAKTVLECEETVKNLAARCAKWEDVFFIGRSLDYAVAMEGQLKLKEISYIHAEAYAAGELKHGTLALITDGVPVIALATQEAVREKTISNIREVKARDALVVGIALEGDTEIRKTVDEVIYLPRANRYLTPALTVIPLQLLAYYAAIARGADVDKPRNLAKSVTVE